MPILYQNNMTTHKHTDVTAEELNQMILHHRKTEYTDAEQVQVFNLVKKYINPHQSTCASCRNNLRDAKNALNSFFLLYKDQIIERLDAEARQAEQTELEKAQSQVEEYKKETKRKNKK